MVLNPFMNFVYDKFGMAYRKMQIRKAMKKEEQEKTKNDDQKKETVEPKEQEKIEEK